MKVIDFRARWCGPCKAYTPIFEKVSKKPEFSHISFETIDVDDDEDAAEKYNIRNIPTTILINNESVEVGRRFGLIPENELAELIENLLCG